MLHIFVRYFELCIKANRLFWDIEHVKACQEDIDFWQNNLNNCWSNASVCLQINKDRKAEYIQEIQRLYNEFRR